MTAPARPQFREDGTVEVPAFSLPPSSLSSEAARKGQAMRALYAGRAPEPIEDVAESRRQLDAMLEPQVQRMLAAYPVTIEDGELGGVPVRVITPADGEYDRDRVLMNLHGGAFSMCWHPCSLLESVPIAAVGRYRVISANYRMAPEARHPAGVEDAAAAYKALLDEFAPGRVGVFGCSAGGALTAQLASWLPRHGLPQPGAIGIFGAGGVRFETGDSATIAGYIDGSFPPPGPDGPLLDIARGYFTGADMRDPVISPALHADAMAAFPPTLLITGTRAMDLSPVVVTNSALLKAGVESTLIVGEAMGHCYHYSPDLPESKDAYDAIVAHFRKRLG